LLSSLNLTAGVRGSPWLRALVATVWTVVDNRWRAQALRSIGGPMAVLPLSDLGRHNTGGLDCWCLPTFHRACDECDVVEYRGAARVYLFEPVKAPGCWKCRQGLIPITRDDAAMPEEALVIVHCH
jgi:hypothetical protein